jgi:hypothetical protein
MNTLDLAAFGADLYPDVAQMHEERRELFRLAAVRALEIGNVPPESLPWYRIMADAVPLNRPLTEGAPA